MRDVGILCSYWLFCISAIVCSDWLLSTSPGTKVAGDQILLHARQGLPGTGEMRDVSSVCPRDGEMAHFITLTKNGHDGALSDEEGVGGSLDPPLSLPNTQYSMEPILGFGLLHFTRV